MTCTCTVISKMKTHIIRHGLRFSTHVCHLGREAAIGCPLMWTKITLGSPEWARVMRRRQPLALTMHLVSRLEYWNAYL